MRQHRALILGLCSVTLALWHVPALDGLRTSWAPRALNAKAQHEPNETEHVFKLGAQSALRLSGTATVGSWRSASDRIEGDFQPGVELEQIHTLIGQLEEARERGRERDQIELKLAPVEPPTVRLTVPTASLRSGRRAMERDMHEALRAEAHPHITYALERIVDANWCYDESERSVSFTLTTRGSLVLAGVRRHIEMDVEIEPIGQKRFRVIGKRAFDMTDFNIEPPSALFGLIRADERVEVVFDLVVEARESCDKEAGDESD